MSDNLVSFACQVNANADIDAIRVQAYRMLSLVKLFFFLYILTVLPFDGE